MKAAAPIPTSKPTEAQRAAEILLRVASMALCLASLILSLKNSVANDFVSISYSLLGSFKYLVAVNGFCVGYSVFAAICTAVPRPLSSLQRWILFFFDQMVAYALMAGSAAGAEIVYLAYEGDKDVTWSKACGFFGGFCQKAAASVCLTFGAAACCAMLSLISSYRLFTACNTHPVSHPFPALELH